MVAVSERVVKCRVDGCSVSHADDQLACRKHWFQLPKPVRDEIWRLYRESPGSDEHRDACFRALAYLDERAKKASAS